MKGALFAATVAFLAAWPSPKAVIAAAYPRGATIIGGQQAYTIRPDDSLPEVARRHDLGYTAITIANPGVDPFVPEPGRRIVLPTEWILPDAPIREGIVVNLAEMGLFLLLARGARSVVTFPIGIGDQGTETPVGRYSIVEKIRNPAWYVPRSIRKEPPDLPAVVPPGPDNPMGSRALRLSRGTLLIHGTNRPWGIGSRDSHGCVRLYEEDIQQLFAMVGKGTPVAVVEQRVKVTAEAGRVYLEVHDPGRGRGLYREVLEAVHTKGLADRVDRDKVRKAIRTRTGLVVDVSKR